jgi:hypothetical protein
MWEYLGVEDMSPCRHRFSRVTCASVWRRKSLAHRFVLSAAKACRTSDRGIPNSRAIRDGDMPALNADRTALS